MNKENKENTIKNFMNKTIETFKGHNEIFGMSMECADDISLSFKITPNEYPELLVTLTCNVTNKDNA